MTLKNKIVSADEAIAIVRDGDTVCVSGFVGIGTPDELILAIQRRFLKDGHPQDLTLVFAAAPDACTDASRAIGSSICVASDTRVIVTCVFIVRSPGWRTETGTPAINDASGNAPLRSR